MALNQYAPKGEVRLSGAIKAGTIMMQAATLIPQSLRVETEPYLHGWEMIKNSDGDAVARDIRRADWNGLQSQIESLNADLEQIASSDPTCVRLQQIPGVGPLVSTAVVSAIGNGAAFKKGREFAAWLGLVPRQWSTGGKAKLLGISKRGNPYLRKMFIHGARAAVLRVKREGSSLGQWMSRLETRAARNVVIVATANKLARISWAVLASGNDYHPRHRALAVSN
jgi:transposase